MRATISRTRASRAASGAIALVKWGQASICGAAVADKAAQASAAATASRIL